MLLFAFSCKNNNKKRASNNPPDLSETNLEETTLDISNLILVDSSDYVLYPLILENQVDVLRIKNSDDEDLKNYWNIIFYNQLSGERHLLDEKRKMVITPLTKSGPQAMKLQPIEDRLFYLITIKDFNNDGYLNSEDPKYLFVSDLNGRNFGQISPDNLNVTRWQYVPDSKKIFMHTIRDSNNDQEFKNDDEIIPLVYEIGSIGFAKEVFSREYKKEVKKNLLGKWTN